MEHIATGLEAIIRATVIVIAKRYLSKRTQKCVFFFFLLCARSSQIDSFCHNQLRVKVICINCSCGTYGNVLNVRVPVQLTSAMFPALLEGFTSLLHAHLKQITSMQIHSVQSHETTLYGAKLLCPGPCLTHNDLQFLGSQEVRGTLFG